MLTQGCGSDPAPARSGSKADSAEVGQGDGGGDFASSDVGFDDLGPDTDTAIGGSDTAASCPGGAGCICVENFECDGGLCIDTPDGKQCAKNCTSDCPSGFKCVQTPVSAGDIASICVPSWGKLCNPCLTTKACSALGQATASCVIHGEAGAFCGADCTQDIDCPSNFRCGELPTVEGTKAKQCVPKGSDAGSVGACSCSQAAISAALATQCTAKAKDGSGGCPGQRACGKQGLSVCTTSEFGDEVCDGADNDCDGKTDEGTCDDSSSCTVDLCVPASATAEPGQCTHTVKNGQPCDADGNACTENDVCEGAVCSAGKVKNCDDNNPCTADSCDLQKGCQHSDDEGAACDDENPCTIGEVCAAGSCLPGKPKNCPTSQQCMVGQCDLQSGKCSYAYADDGYLCDDGTLCSTNDTCQKGACKGKVQNCDDGNTCSNDGCESTSGCTHTPAGAVCDDGNACTDSDHCDGGNCVTLPKPASACDDNNACTTDSCDPLSGCVHAIHTGPCEDGDACTVGDTCKSGVCTAGNQSCPCQVDADCAVQEDGNLCNGTLYCKAITTGKVCVIDPASIVNCTSAVDTTCQKNLCDPKNGICTMKSMAEGTPCDADSSVCTASDGCAAGLCTAGAKVDCDDKNPCTTDSCSPVNGCQHVANSDPCDADNNACSKNDTCEGKVCLPGPMTICDDKNACTQDACSTITGICSYASLPKDGSPCDADNTLCTAPDLCGSGVCTAGAVVNCDDQNPCTDDACTPLTGCQHVANTLACNADDSECTKNDFCSGSKCTAGPKTVCDDNKPCTKDTCNPLDGKCIFDTPGANGTPCDADFSVCTQGDACKDGLCLPGPATTCDDLSPCTSDKCDVKTGCSHTTLADDSVCNGSQVCKAGVCKDPYPCNFAYEYDYGGIGNDYPSAMVVDSSGSTIGINTEASVGGPTDAWILHLPASGVLKDTGGWSSVIGGIGTDEVHDVVASLGGYVVAGRSNSPGTAGGFDVLLARLDSYGTKQWQSTLGGTADESGNAVAATATGNFVVGTQGDAALFVWTDMAGKQVWSKSMAGSRFFDAAVSGSNFVALGDTTLKSAGLNDCLLAQIDAKGTVLWTRVFGGAKADQCNSLVVLTDGYLLAGQTLSSGAGDSDAWLIRTDLLGNKLWERTYGGSSTDVAMQVVAAPQGFALVGTSQAGFGGDAAEAWVVRTDALGNKLSTAVFGGPGDQYGYAIGALKDAFVVAGSTNNHLGLKGFNDVWVFRADPWLSLSCKASGACGPLLPTDCDDGNACTADWCSPGSGCSHAALAPCN